MRVNGANFKNFLLGLTLVSASTWGAADAAQVQGLQVSTGATGTRAEISLDQAGEFKIISLAGPDRLVIDLPASSIATNLQVPAGAGVVTAVRTGQPVPGTVRIVFDLGQSVTPITPRIEPGPSGPRLVVQWPGDGAVASVAHTALPAGEPRASQQVVVANSEAVVPAPSVDQSAASAEATSRLISQIAARVAVADAATRAAASSTVPTTIATGIPTQVATGKPAAPAAPVRAATDPVKTLGQIMQGRGMRPLVIAIDPGHGGQDPGAIGQSGTREKDVVLAISKELARQIDATPGLKSYMTRDNDMFIPLNKRAQLARAAKADLFISIHADAAENRGADGSSVYVLSLRGASSQRARWLADKENSSDLVGGVRLAQTNNTLASVLLDLTQSGHMKASADAAEEILDGLKRVGNIHKHHIERANFAVLRTSDMPAMLVETAFISNPAEEIRLQQPAFQRQLASAVLDGVNTFFTRQPPPGTMYAAQAALTTASAGAAGGSP